MIKPRMAVATGLWPVGVKHDDARVHYKRCRNRSNALKRHWKRRSRKASIDHVDGDMSTNDSVIMFAMGSPENSRLENRDSRLGIFRRALAFVTLELAKMIVPRRRRRDPIHHPACHGSAQRARSRISSSRIANSTLVKTSWCGGDPKLGRILCALGYSTAKVEESIIDVGYSRAGEREIAFASGVVARQMSL